MTEINTSTTEKWVNGVANDFDDVLKNKNSKVLSNGSLRFVFFFDIPEPTVEEKILEEDCDELFLDIGSYRMMITTEISSDKNTEERKKQVKEQGYDSLYNVIEYYQQVTKVEIIVQPDEDVKLINDADLTEIEV